MLKNNKVFLLFSTILISFLLPACAEKYRYECQDPENWEDPKCNPPLCLVDNMCTDVLLGLDAPLPTEEPQQDVEQNSDSSQCQPEQETTP